MKLFGKILLTSLLPLVASLVVIIILTTGTIRNELAAVDRNDQLRIDLVKSRLNGVMEDLSVAASVLSASKDAARAVQFAEADFLFEWSRLFHGRSVSKIIFTDMDGLVLSRSDDEFSFGDDMSGHPAVKKAVAGERSTGFYKIDGSPCFAYGGPVLLYGEVPVGSVLACVEITPVLLSNIAAGTGLFMSFEGLEGASVSSNAGREVRKRVTIPLEADPDCGEYFRMFAEFPQEQSLARLRELRRNFMLIVTGTWVLLPAVLLVLLRVHLRPYAALVGGLMRLSEKKTDFSGLRAEFDRRFTDPNHEVTIIARAVSRLTVTLEENFRLLQKLSATDKLTGLYNRLHLDTSMANEIRRAARYSTPFTILLLDLDHFKEVNDNHGHGAGDEVLKGTAAAITADLRSTDIAGRWGGEEFCVLCPNTRLEGGRALGEKIRRNIEEMESPIGAPVTASIGIADFRQGDTSDSLLGRADKALYAAKAAGRNRVEYSA